MGVPERTTSSNMAGKLAKVFHLKKKGSGEKGLTNLHTQVHPDAPPSLYDRLGTTRKHSLDEASLQREISVGLGRKGKLTRDMRKLTDSQSSLFASVDDLGSASDITKAAGHSTILNKLLRERNKSLDELSIGSEAGYESETQESGALSRRRTFMDLTEACGSFDEESTPNDNDTYSKSYGGESLFKRRMRSLDEPTEGTGDASPGLNRRPTLPNLHLEVESPKVVPPPGITNLLVTDTPLVDTVDDGGGSKPPTSQDPVTRLAQTPGADILQVLMLHTDRQLLKQLSRVSTNLGDAPDAAGGTNGQQPTTTNRHSAALGVPGTNRPRSNTLGVQRNGSNAQDLPRKLSPKTPRANSISSHGPMNVPNSLGTMGNPSTPGVQMRRKKSQLRRSVRRRTLLGRDELYDKVNAAITPRHSSGAHFDFPTPRSRASGGAFSYDINSPVPRTPLYLPSGGGVSGSGLTVRVPPVGTLCEGEQAQIPTPGGGIAVIQTPLEHKIGRMLRAKGDEVAVEMNAQFAPVVSEILRDVTYKRFREVMQQTLGQQAGWCQVAALVNVTRSAVAWAGYGTKAALKVKESTLKYFEDHLSGWVLGQGGWESIVDEQLHGAEGGEQGAS